MKISKLLFVIFFIVGLFFGASNAQNMQHILPSIEKLNPTNNSDNSPKTADLHTNFDNLIAKAQTDGTVKIIVGFRVENYRSDSALNELQQTKQRGDIKQKQAILLNRLSDFGVKNVRQFDYIPFMAIEIGADALNFLRDSGEIISIQEDEPQKPSLLQSVLMIGGSAFGGATGGTFTGFSGQGRTIAILDSGVDKFHPFFNGRVVSEACYSANSANSTSLCPGGVNSSTASGSGVNCNVNQFSQCTHGTHVAGIAAGGHPQITGNGVARNANIIAIQVFSSSTSCGGGQSPCLRSNTSDTIAGLERVYALRTSFNIDAVNMSLGGGQYFSYCDTEQSAYKLIIDNLRSANIASVVASGNDGFHNSIGSPACISSAISVGSVHDGTVAPPDNVSTFSNGAAFLNMLAPGEVITSSVPGGIYEDSQGTSQAAPHVAGGFAVVRQKFPSDSVSQIFTRLKYGGILVLDQNNGTVKPRIHVNFALTTSNVDPCSLPVPISFGQTINASIAFSDCQIPPGLTDVYTFSASQGQQIAITQTSTAIDPYLYLLSPAGSIIAFDNNGGGGTNSRIPANSGFFTIPTTGTYTIFTANASFFTNSTGNYSVSLINGGGGCNFTISSSAQNFASSGGAGNFNVNTTAGCAWTAQSNAAWLTTTSTGNGNGAVNYSVAANTSSSPRTGTINAGGQVHTVTQAGATVTTVRAPFDFDGDNKTDLSIFRPAGGEWWYLKSSTGGNAAAQFGSSTDKIVPGDYTGDGKSDFAFFRPSTGQWFILRSEDFSFFAFPFGNSTDTPVPADYDGDGKTDAAVFRASNTTWYINKSSGGTDIIGFGAATDKPVPADYDGDGKADVAIFRPNGASGAEWWIRRSSNAGVFAVTFGASTDKAVRGDYTGDGKADIAVWRPSNGNWFILRSEDFSFYAFPFGANGDIPVAGDYDGDGRFDAGVFRPSSNSWFVQRSTAGTLIQTFGIAGDLAVPNAFVP